ncbi:MAG: DMT family transporter [Acidobacteriota bacterium]
MDLIPTIVLIASALAWISYDLVRKHLVTRAPPLVLAAVLVTAQVPATLLWVTFDGWYLPANAYWLPGLASLLLNVVATFGYLVAVHRSPISATVPLLALTPVFSTLFAMPVLGEIPGPWVWLGVILVVVGALTLNARPGTHPLRSLLHEPGAPYMVLVAVCWSITPAFDKIALRHAISSHHAFVLSAGTAIVFIIATVRIGGLGTARRLCTESPWWVMVAGTGAVVAILLQLWAIQIAWVGLVETVKRGLGGFAALLFGALLFAESIDRRQMLAVVVMVVGVALVLLTGSS